jgi:hypothetical protein
MCDSCESGGRKEEWRFKCSAKKRCAGIYACNVSKNAWDEFILLECCRIATHGDLVFCSAIDVVKDSVRETTFGNEAKVSDIGCAFKATFVA